MKHARDLVIVLGLLRKVSIDGHGHVSLGTPPLPHSDRLLRGQSGTNKGRRCSCLESPVYQNQN